MKISAGAVLGLSMLLAANAAIAEEGKVPQGVPQLDHVFLIMMENHGYSQIVNNPNAPYTNYLIQHVNSSTNYYALAHPSLNNYLEVVGGSNFGVQTDNYPDWHSTSCTPNLASGITATDNPPSPKICLISGSGTDAPIPAIDYTNETQGPPGTVNIDGKRSIAASKNISGKTIADQLVEKGLNYKSYQESIPLNGIDYVNYSDGFYTDSTNFTKLVPAQNPPFSTSQVVALYAVKHNPFAYFQNVQEGTDPNNSLNNTVDFVGPHGLFADLATGHLPSLAFIAPNQCNDQHGRGNAGPFCNYDPTDNGTQAGLNPALINRGDVTIHRLVDAIHKSPVWHDGHRNAIVIVWDENDYSLSPNSNKVLLLVDTNYGSRALQSNAPADHFSLLKSLEAGFGLPCLNHACDAGENVMSDLFSAR